MLASVNQSFPGSIHTIQLATLNIHRVTVCYQYLLSSRGIARATIKYYSHTTARLRVNFTSDMENSLLQCYGIFLFSSTNIMSII